MTASLELFPDTARVTTENRLAVGGCDVVELAGEFGTPLYVYDAATIVARAGAFREALRASYPGTATVCYASKAYIAPWLLALLAPLGLGLDVVSGGELHVAARADFPRERIYFHGNNKSEAELRYALEQRIGRVVIDNLEEIALLGRLAAESAVTQPVLLRLAPGVDVHTHPHLTTGAAETAVRAVLARSSLELRGFHAHIGSQIRDAAPYRTAIDRIFAFASAMREKTDFLLRELSPGGGYFVRYVPGDPKVDPLGTVREVARAVLASSTKHTIDQPELTIEPGRAIVAPAAIALYRVGSVKRGARTYVAVDGGMADNIRPTAYGAEYTALLASRVDDGGQADVAIAGKYCETGDILIQKVTMPLPRAGDIVAVPVSGAYHLAMAGNYNMSPRPAVVVVTDGGPRLVQRRETYDDLTARDL
jgi:diaminopimelate decarboxylase